MPVHRIESLDDRRVAAYRNLKDRALERQGRRFIAEGEYIVRRLLASDFEVESMLLSEKRAAEMAAIAPADLPVFIVSTEQMTRILGMKFHSGILACGIRKPQRSIDDCIPRDKPRLLLMILPDISNVENIGSLIRLAAGFGADAVILGEHCHDPWWRQSIRVSMGTIFTLAIVQSENLARDMERLKKEWKVEMVASVLDEDAEPLDGARRGAKLGLLFGGEAQGLSPAMVQQCDRKVTIPMHHGTDSLNVATAAGIMLYHFTRADSFR